MNKKGISPLIGTVLLVAIVIAMILLIMPWMTKTIKTQQEKTTEATRQFDCVTELNFDLKEGDNGKIMVDNRGNVDITKLIFRLYGPGGGLADVTIDNPNIISPGTDETVVVGAYGIVTFDDIVCDGTDVVRVEAIATISSGGKDLTCGDVPRDYEC